MVRTCEEKGLLEKQRKDVLVVDVKGGSCEK